MTVLSRKQAEAACPEAFGLTGPPDRCDLCLKPASTLTRVLYGPFTAWLCSACEPAWKARRDQA